MINRNSNLSIKNNNNMTDSKTPPSATTTATKIIHTSIQDNELNNHSKQNSNDFEELNETPLNLKKNDNKEKEKEEEEEEEENINENNDIPQYNISSPIPDDLYELLTPVAILAKTDEVSLTAFLLGSFFGASLLLVIVLLLQPIIITTTTFSSSSSSSTSYLPTLNTLNFFSNIFVQSTIPWQIPAYGVSLSLFHFLEYWTTAKYNPSKVSPSSFLLRNGKAYLIAHAIAIFEALIERYVLTFLPSYIRLTVDEYSFSSSSSSSSSPLIGSLVTFYLSLFGLFLIICGQTLRSAAMIHAASNFSHTIVRARDSKHELVTTGVYSISRHPSYAGFFYWALGTQLLLVNPISFFLFLYILWKFFADRIEDEEELLVSFFGKNYIQYRKSTKTLIPFIK